MVKKSKISRSKGVELCVERMILGESRKDILPFLVKTYHVSESTVTKWMKVASITVKERQQQAEALRVKEMDAATTEALKSGLKSDLELEAFLSQIAMDGVTVEQILAEGVVITRSATPSERLKAVELLWKKRGSYAPTKSDVNVTGGVMLVEKESHPADDPIN
jgi:hypothetical protein